MLGGNPPGSANLRAVVYRVDRPWSAAPSFVEVLDVPLGYPRKSPSGNIASCNDPISAHGSRGPRSHRQAARRPPAPPVGTINENNNPSFPQLTAITFAEDGSIILGFRDLIGDMGGVNVPGEIGTGNQSGIGPMLHGDQLRAGANADGTSRSRKR